MHRLLIVPGILLLLAPFEAPAAELPRAIAEPFRASLEADIAAFRELEEALRALQAALAEAENHDLAADADACASTPALKALCAEISESVR